MDNQIEEIKNKIDIINFLGSFITLKKTGRNFKAVCPFHQEKTPSFIVSPERQIWHCFGACGEGGDVIKFLMKWENITFYEALKELAEKVGVRLKRANIDDKNWEKKERLLAINNLAKDFYHFVLTKAKFGEKALAYLKDRQINKGTIEKFQLGYAPASWDSLIKFLRKKKYELAEIFEAGLVVKSQRGSYYDRFRGRLIFPIKNLKSETIGFSGRLIDSGAQEAKYINSPETFLYHKRQSLFGIDLAKEAIKKEKNVILVEGEFDMITPYQRGIENIVAIKGSAVTEEQLMILKRYSPRINLALDADNAGEEAIRRAIIEGENLEVEIGIITIEGGKDPDEAIRKDPDSFKKSLKKTSSIYDFIIDFYMKKFPKDDPFDKKNIIQGVLPFITAIRNPIIKSYTLKKIADLLTIDEHSIQSAINRYIRQKDKDRFFSKKAGHKEEVMSRDQMMEKYLLSLVLQDKNPLEIAAKIFSIMEVADLSIVAYQKLVKLLLEQKAENKIEDFIVKLPAELKEVFDEIYLYASLDIDLKDEDLKKIIYSLKKDSINRKIKKILSSKEKMTKEEEKKVCELSLKIKEVEKSLEKL